MSDTKPSKAPAAALGALAIGLSAATVMHFEGLELTGYADPVGIPTECWGSTPNAKIGLTRSLDYCKALLSEDLRTHWAGVSRCIKTELYPHEAAAILSWTFNVGVGAACKSTLIKLANAGKPFCGEFEKWVYASGVKFKGLVRRRAAERALCEGKA